MRRLAWFIAGALAGPAGVGVGLAAYIHVDDLLHERRAKRRDRPCGNDWRLRCLELCDDVEKVARALTDHALTGNEVEDLGRDLQLAVAMAEDPAWRDWATSGAEGGIDA